MSLLPTDPFYCVYRYDTIVHSVYCGQSAQIAAENLTVGTVFAKNQSRPIAVALARQRAKEARDAMLKREQRKGSICRRT